jgi:hypothetical protein
LISALLVSYLIGEKWLAQKNPPFIPLWQRGKEGNLLALFCRTMGG